MPIGWCRRHATREDGSRRRSRLGLGRAFFYAGTRASCHQPVGSFAIGARTVTNLFKRQADDPKLTRGEALRQAMMALADGPGYLGVDGRLNSLWHPLFGRPIPSS
jgi:hypothetical protein